MDQQTEICIDLSRVFTLPITEHGVLVWELLLLLETEFTSSATKSCQTLGGGGTTHAQTARKSCTYVVRFKLLSCMRAVALRSHIVPIVHHQAAACSDLDLLVNAGVLFPGL
jgi:hypothetical protein